MVLSRIRPRLLLIMMTAVIVLVGAGLFVRHGEAERSSGLLVDELPTSARMLVIGDSYADGTGADSQGTSWAYLAARDLGWRPTIQGVGGTGFTWGTATDGTPGQDFLTRLNQIAATRETFDVVVIEGGQNDYRATPEVLAAAVTETIEAAREAWPNAPIIVLGPVAPQPLGDKLSRMADPIEAAAVGAGAYAIDPVEERWITTENTPTFRFDDAHVNQAGHNHIAARFIDSVQAFHALR